MTESSAINKKLNTETLIQKKLSSFGQTWLRISGKMLEPKAIFGIFEVSKIQHKKQNHTFIKLESSTSNELYSQLRSSWRKSSL